jgi:hypothetical protein
LISLQFPSICIANFATKFEGYPAMFSKFSIRAKIVTVVSLLLAALAGMGLLAAKEIQAINGNTVEIATNGCRAFANWASCMPASSATAPRSART